MPDSTLNFANGVSSQSIAPLSIIHSDATFKTTLVKGLHFGIYDDNNATMQFVSASGQQSNIDFKEVGGTQTEYDGRISYDMTKGFEFYTNNTVRCSINQSTGNVGIGTTSPSYPLEIQGNSSYTGAMYYFEGSGSSWLYSGDNTVNCGVWVNDSIRALSFFQTSDERLKKDIVEINDNISLQKLRDISCCSYKYIDYIKQTDRTQIGFIAQQVNKYLPEAISLHKDFIPDIMKNLENVSWAEDTSGNFKMISTDILDSSGIKFRFYVCDDISDNDVHKVELIGNSDNSFIFNKKWNHIFCYGKEIDDLYHLDKSKLFAINFSATQEIDRIQQEEKTKLTEAQNKINTLETQNAELLTRLEALEKRLSDAGI